MREIAIVVVGILIAFGLDAWWNTWQQRREAAEELRGIHAELTESERMLGDLVTSDTVKIAAIEALIAAASPQGEGGSTVVPDTLFRWLLRTGTYEPPIGRVESLLASGNIALVEDLRLRERIAGWPSRVRDAREHQDRMRDFWMSDLAPHLREQTAPDEMWDASPTGMVRLPASRSVLHLLYQFRFHARIVAFNNRQLHEELQALRQHVGSVIEPAS